MGIPEVFSQWVLTSTGASTTVCDGLGLQCARLITVEAHTKAGTTDTAVFGIEHGYSSTDPFERLGSTAYSLSSGGASLTIQIDGPLFAVRPYLIARTASTTILTITVTAS